MLAASLELARYVANSQYTCSRNKCTLSLRLTDLYIYIYICSLTAFYTCSFLLPFPQSICTSMYFSLPHSLLRSASAGFQDGYTRSLNISCETDETSRG